MNKSTAILDRLTQTKNVLKKLLFRIGNLNGRYFTDYYDRLLNPILDLMDDNLDFVDLLWDYFWNELPNKDHLKFGIKKGEEVKKLSDLFLNLNVSNENQTLAFKFDEIYNKRIVSVSNFTLNRPSKLIYDFRSTSTLYYDVVLPFHDKNYDENSTDCTTSLDLPYFFKRFH